MISKVTIIGTGNIATWFTLTLSKKNIQILQIYDRDIVKSTKLATQCHANPIDKLNLLSNEADLFLFAIKDDCLATLLQDVPFKMPLAIHTAGSLSQSIFKNYAERYGIIYPYQSINKKIEIDHLIVPLAIEGNNSETTEILFQFAQCFSSTVYKIDEQQRFAMHIAAIFGNNFTNALYSISYKILKDNNIDWNIILPLLEETCSKIKKIEPKEAQTGPAKRGDEKIIESHCNYLKDKEIQDIYRILSQYIISQQKNE